MRGVLMKKAYGIVVYEGILNEAKLEAYVELAPKAFDKYGAKFFDPCLSLSVKRKCSQRAHCCC